MSLATGDQTLTFKSWRSFDPRWVCAGAVVAWLLSAAGGCVAGSMSPAGTTVHRSTRERRGIELEGYGGGFDARSNRFVLQGAAREVVMFELGLTCSGSRLDRVNLAVGKLVCDAATIEPGAVRLFRLHPVFVKRQPGWQIRMLPSSQRRQTAYDAAVPSSAPHGGLPAMMDGGDVLRILVEIHIPNRTPPGKYEGAISVTDRGTQLRSISVELNVRPLTLRDPTSVVLQASFDHRALVRHHVRIDGRPYEPTTALRAPADSALGARLGRLVDDTVRLLRDHGVAPVLETFRPVVKIDRRERVSVDWTDFDRDVGPILNAAAGDGPPCRLSIPVSADFPAAASFDTVLDPVSERILTAYFRSFERYLSELGLLERAFVSLPPDGARGRNRPASVAVCAELLRRVAPKLRIASEWSADDLPVHTWRRYRELGLEESIDVWLARARSCDPGAAPAGVETWMRVGRPPYSGTVAVGAAEVHTRVIPWQARRYGLSTVDLGDAMNWPATRRWRDPTPQECIEHDPSTLLYPGAFFGLDEPVASMRLKALRRGMQDVAYLEMLAENGLEHVGETLVHALVRYALTDAYRNHYGDVRECGWIVQAEYWDAARGVMIDELVRAASPDREASKRGIDAVVRWRKLMDETGGIGIPADGARVRLTGEVGVNRVEAWVRLENRTRVAVEGSLRFEDIAAGWVAPEPEVVIGAIEPGADKTVSLIAVADHLAWGEDGLAVLPIRFDTADGTVHRGQVRLAYITSQRINRPITIDGDLSDWPVGSGNVASSFVSLAGGEPMESDSIAGQTRCAVLHDDDYLYFGFVAALSGPDATAPSSGNRITYEDTVPMEGELVEILIDPTNAGTHAPEDLYHVLVKRTGAAVFERGVGTDPPIGHREPWATDAEYAVGSLGNAWIVEIRVPRDDFEFRAAGPQIWGINFTRFDGAGGEYGTWSGARHNAYDPMSLGNVSLR